MVRSNVDVYITILWHNVMSNATYNVIMIVIV